MIRVAVALALLTTPARAQVPFPPHVLYSTAEAIGVAYRTGGILHSSREEAAYKLVAEHCKGKFRITGRATSSDGVMTLDAACTK